MYLQENKLAKESDYVYKAQDGTCKADQYDKVEGISSYDSPASVSDIQNEVAKRPCSIAIQAQGTVQAYTGGIIERGTCGTQLDHAVAIVGY